MAAQRAAIDSEHARVAIIAGAGTGKTHTLTHRLARLIERGAAPESIVLVTFTNRAAQEMIQRAAELLGPAARRVRAGTFHGLAFADLKKHGPAIGLPAKIGIIGRRDAGALLREVCPDLTAPRRVLDVLSLAINTEQPLANVFSSARDLDTVGHRIEDIADRYAEAKAHRRLLDFDDLLVAYRVLLSVEPTITKDITNVLVDEYQDTNFVQADIAERLSQHGSLCIVGDDAQSIFAFRGARHENILGFAERRPTDVHLLTTSFRSHGAILDVANAVLRFNVRQHHKTLTSARPRGAFPELIVADSDLDEAETIVSAIRRLQGEGIGFDRQAVLYRAHRQSEVLQAALQRAGIPFSVRASARFFESDSPSRLLCALRVVENVGDDAAWRGVLAGAPGIGAQTVRDVLQARRGGLTPSATLRRVRRASPLATIFEALEACTTPAERVRTAIEKWALDAELLAPIEALAAESDDQSDFIARLILSSEEASQSGGVTLSTVHQAKGLEWTAVFVMQLTDGAFPHRAAFGDEDQIEEERRLLHVAVTRAKDYLCLSRPSSTSTVDGRIPLPPSRFLDELDPALFARPRRTP